MSESGSDARFYDIKVVATDPSGNVGEATCTVIAVPEYDPPSGKSAKKSKPVPRPSRESLLAQLSASRQRYVLDELNFVWNIDQDDSVVPPAVPNSSKSQKKKKGFKHSKKNSARVRG